MYDHPFHRLPKGFKCKHDSITAKADTRKKSQNCKNICQISNNQT